jgi:coniferyl-aldehyde dehydrogenase
MKAAADNLTPVILELGGKSPAIIAPDYPVDAAVKRILLGKCFNAGQTCIAPDYVLLHQDQLKSFIHFARKEIGNLYPNFLQNNDYSLIINDQHCLRLQSYLQDAEKKGADIYPLAPSTYASKRRLPPTLISRVTDDMVVMQEEIFGPLLPIVCYQTLEDAIDYVNKHPKPLALYYFDFDKARCDHLLSSTQSGGVTVNDVLCHISQDELPFGGVGPSGMGSYHGIDGFNAFSKRKGIFFQSTLNAVAWMKPPFKKRVDWLIKFLIR